jgi:formylglycine-generating enzyme required for sulfatase activity
MKRIPAAGVTWTMGDSVSAPLDGMYRPHRVSFSSDFYIGVYEVTQKQLELATGRKRPTFTDFSDAEDADIMPADKVGYGQINNSEDPLHRDTQLRGYNKWPDDGHSIAATSAIISKFRLLGVDFDLPTSAQWEYACRAGTASCYNNGFDSGLDQVGWYSANSNGMPHPVGEKDSNDFGLYDMHGNVSEWVLDWYDPDGSSIKDYDEDPIGLKVASSTHSVARTWRGGSYKSGASGCCSYVYGNRNWNAALESGFGFRLWAPVGVCE